LKITVSPGKSVDLSPVGFRVARSRSLGAVSIGHAVRSFMVAAAMLLCTATPLTAVGAPNTTPNTTPNSNTNLSAGQLPTGGQLVGGRATIAQQGLVMGITQSSARAAIAWSSFDIGSAATVNIVQP
jgi:hypothetical protein